MFFEVKIRKMSNEGYVVSYHHNYGYQELYFPNLPKLFRHLETYWESEEQKAKGDFS